MKLNLGCCDAVLEGYVNVDLAVALPNPMPANCMVADLSIGCWPWHSSSVDHIKAHDIFEHLPDKIMVMNEAHRVLKPGGTLDLFIPTTDGRGAFQDPTHKSWWTPNDLFYFVRHYAEWKRFHQSYGITACFDIPRVNQAVPMEQLISRGFIEHRNWGDNVWKLRCSLVAVK